MREVLQMVALFMSPLVLIGWVYGLAQAAVYLWDLRIGLAVAIALLVTVTQFCALFAATPAVFEDDALGEKE